MEKETHRRRRRRKILTTLNSIFEYGPRQPGGGGRIEESDIVLTALQMTDGMKEILKGILDKLKKLDTIKHTVKKIEASMVKLEERTARFEASEKTAKEDIEHLKS